MVRHYARGGASAIHREERAGAISQLGRAARDALNEAQAPATYEAILTAILDGLSPANTPRF